MRMATVQRGGETGPFGIVATPHFLRVSGNCQTQNLRIHWLV